MSNTEINRKMYRVVLRLGEQSVPLKIETARRFVSRITGNPAFPNPDPSLADITGEVMRLEQLWAESRDGSRSALRRMYNSDAQLNRLLIRLGNYVEGIANQDAAPDVIITGAGMQYKTVTGSAPRVFSLRNGDLSGVIHAVTRTENSRASYLWEYRLKGASAWIQAGITVRASRTFTGLTPGSVYEFRQRTITAAGEGNWSDVLELMAV